LDTHVATLSQQFFSSRDELCVEVSGKSLGRIVRQYSGEHYCIVLCVSPLVVFFGDELANPFSRFCSSGSRLGGVNNGREVEVLVSLEEVSTVGWRHKKQSIGRNRTALVLFGPPDSQKAVYHYCQPVLAARNDNTSHTTSRATMASGESP
jgi:hypothetical protein